MKYLKLFEEIDHESEIVKTLKEICLELEDYGYTILHYGQYDFYLKMPLDTITIDKFKKHGNRYERVVVDFSEIKEYLLRIKDYLGNKYVGFRYNNCFDWQGTELNDNTNIKKLYIARIYYKL